jgi:hypothetical protein
MEGQALFEDLAGDPKKLGEDFRFSAAAGLLYTNLGTLYVTS